MGKTIDIGGRIHNPEVGNVVTGANEILDDTKNKKQDVINSEVDAALEALDANKQDNLTFDQTPTESSTNPVTSGGVYAADLALQQAIEAILTLIPSAASALNQLADKSFVNSSIATASATFRGTYNLVSDLHLSVTASHQDIATALASVVSTADNNDYCFVQIPTSDTSSDIRVTERYKFNGTAWQYEYDLNNSGFTAQQWEAINSGITALLVTKLGALPTAAELATSLAGKQNVLTFDNVPVSGSDNPVKSSGLYQLFTAIDAKFPSDASSSNKLVAENRLAAYVTAIIEALDASFDVTSTDGHVTFKMTQTNGVIASVQILTSDIASASALTTLGGQVSTNASDIAALQALYNALQQSAPQIIQPSDTWPVANPSTTVIYRVIDRVNTPPQYYSDYMWNGTAMVLMATYNNAIDDIPTRNSNNLVKSGGVYNLVSQVICESQTKPNDYLAELYVSTPKGKKAEFKIRNFQYSATTGLTVLIYNSSNVEVFSCFRKTDVVAGEVYEMLTTGVGYEGYHAYLVWNGNTTEYATSGVSWVLSDYVYNLRSWNVIGNYLTNITKETSNLFAKIISSDKKPSEYFSEFYVSTPSGKAESFKITQLVFNTTDGITISVKDSSNVLVADIFRQKNLVTGKVYEIPIVSDSYKGYHFYYVYNGNTTSYSISGSNFVLDSQVFNLRCWTTIENYLSGSTLNTLQNEIDIINDEINPPLKKWCSNDDINAYIEELYIPNASTRFANGLKVERLVISKKEIRLWFKDNNSDYVLQISVSLRKYHVDEADGSYRTYYGCGAISPVYAIPAVDGTTERIGYIKFKYNGIDYATSGISLDTDLSLIGDVNNSPSIKKMLSDDRQIILLGDSHFGYPNGNILTSVIQGITGIKAYNLGFGGCRMAWRSADGSNPFDVYTFPNIADALVSQSFSSQEAQVDVPGGMGYSLQVADLEAIDITKPMQIILKFGANDCTGDTVIGNMWADDPNFDITDTSDVTAKLASLDRNTYCGAMNYALLKLFNAFPTLLNFQAMSSGFGYREVNGQRQAPQTYINGIGLKQADYDNALKDNCRLLGMRYEEYNNSGIMNAFNLRPTEADDPNIGIGIDGSGHFEEVGFAMFGQYLSNISKHFYD